MKWLEENQDHVRELFIQHIWLSVIPVLFGLAFALPLGWVANRYQKPRAVILGIGSTLYTIPSLPLLIVLPSVLGTSFLDPINVIIVLTAYAAALLVHTATNAFRSVPGEILDAAAASGHSTWQRALTVELPLAGPVLLAGIRVVSVSTVSIATIGPLIGVSNLGSLFTDGFQRGFPTEIVIGVIAVVLLALILDLLWVTLGRLWMPWNTRTRDSARGMA